MPPISDIANLFINAADMAFSSTPYGQNFAQVKALRQEGESRSLKDDLETLKTMYANPHANPDEIQMLAKKIITNNPKLAEIGNKMRSVAFKTSNAPYGVSDDQMGELNRAEVGAAIKKTKQNGTDPLKRLKDVTEAQDNNMDASTNKPRDQRIADYLSGEIESITGKPADVMQEKPQQITLADMIGGYSQDTTRRPWWKFGDDTVSSQNIKQASDNYVQTLQLETGISREEARKQAAKEYGEMMAGDTGTFQKYPKMDLSRLFTDDDTRKEAIKIGQTVLDNGDGIQTTPPKMQDMGINDIDTQEQFSTLEKMIGKDAGIDLRADYQKEPEFYKELFKAIKDGVSDGKGGKRKLSTQEIIDLIKGA